MVPRRARDLGEGLGQVVSETLRGAEDPGGSLIFKDLDQAKSSLLSRKPYRATSLELQNLRPIPCLQRKLRLR